MLNRRHLFCSAVAGLGRVFPTAAVPPHVAHGRESGVSSKAILIGNSSKLSGPLSDVVKAYLGVAQLGAPSYVGLEGYIAGTVLVEALRRCSTDLTRSRLNTVMKSLQLRFAGMSIDYSGDTLNGSRYIDLASVKSDGTFLR